MELCQKTAHELQGLLHKGEIKATEIVESLYARIGAVEGKVHAYLTLTRELAEEQAAAVDRALAGGKELPPLAGIPVAVKDSISTAGIRTTCASKILENYVPVYDGTVVELLKQNQLVLLGKTNMDEFAMGSSTENSAFFTTCNPWDLQAVPGGSSGGSAAAVSAAETILALGSDTGGSIRQPAAYCGIVGLKPTYGRVSRYGLIAYASSFDQVGPLTKDVTDCALLMQVLAKHDPRDPTTVDYPVPDYLQELKQPVKGLRLGLVKEYLGAGISAPVQQALQAAVGVYRDLGVELVEVELPHSDAALAAYYIIAAAEASSNLARYDGVRYGFRTQEAVTDAVDLFMKTRGAGLGSEVKRRIMIGTYVLSAGYYDAYYGQAQQVRQLIREDFNNAFKKCDLLLTPTTPEVAFGLGSKTQDPVAMYAQDICTITANLAGLPGISFPAGFYQGLPIGLQLVGPAFKEGSLLRAAYAFEQATGYQQQRPQL